jgi:hypothetical protein
MKRINPTTGAPFKRGETREDGLRFFSYQVAQFRKDGTHPEIWLTDDVFNRNKKKALKTTFEFRATKEGRAGKLLNAAYSRTQKSGGIVTIDKQWILNKLNLGICEITKLPFDLNSSKTFRNPYSPSLDRIDNSNKDYTPENTRVVLTSVNICLSEFGEEKLYPILKAMVNYIKDKK